MIPFKQFYESTLQTFYVIVATGDGAQSRKSQLQATSILKAITEVLIDNEGDVGDSYDNDAILYVHGNIAVVEFDCGEFFFVTDRPEYHTKSMEEVCDVVQHIENVAPTTVDIPNLLAKYKYKETATKDIDADLGFGDLLDVL